EGIRWRRSDGKLSTRNGDAGWVPDWLRKLAADPRDMTQFADGWAYLCPEGTTWSAAFAVMPYLVRAAAGRAAGIRRRTGVHRQGPGAGRAEQPDGAAAVPRGRLPAGSPGRPPGGGRGARCPRAGRAGVAVRPHGGVGPARAA